MEVDQLNVVTTCDQAARGASSNFMRKAVAVWVGENDGDSH